MISIRRALETDFESIWTIFQQVVAGGDTFAYDSATTKEQARSLWFSEHGQTFVACRDNQIVGAYLIKPNQPGRGAHVANAAYMVKPTERGQGIGRLLGAHSLEAARQAGYSAMQFNIVVSTNESAVALWQRLGFVIIGTSPKAFRHEALGLVDAYIMHRFL